jgi:hypothetical protein
MTASVAAMINDWSAGSDGRLSVFALIAVISAFAGAVYPDANNGA